MITSTNTASIIKSLASQKPGHLDMGAQVQSVSRQEVVLENGLVHNAGLVIDSRGALPPKTLCGYQKFYGEEITVSQDHGIKYPIVMDATVCQIDGFHFIYVLPIGPRLLLVEDTIFSNVPELNVEEGRRAINSWLSLHGFVAIERGRTERGVLPMPLEDHTEPDSNLETTKALQGGYRGGWFHPTTGYSLSQAARLAEIVSTTQVDDLDNVIRQTCIKRKRTSRFYLFLNRLMFEHYLPADRRNIFEQFYRLPEPLIQRFYAMRSTFFDKTRILSGKPPAGFCFRRFDTHYQMKTPKEKQ
jgi:lycopene beta-cyclase